MGEGANMGVAAHYEMASLQGFSLLASKTQHPLRDIGQATLSLCTELFMSPTLYTYSSLPAKHA